MYYDHKLYIAKDGDQPIYLLPGKANRHGLIAGATGTGKTVSMRVLAESFSDAGVPVFLADVKGDLAAMCKPGVHNENMDSRIARFGLEDCGFAFRSYPVSFWDIFGQKGLPLRTTITEMGPVLLSKLLELTPTQEDILNIVFRIADEEGLLLIDTKDLRAMLDHVAENAQEYSQHYGNMGKASLNVIQRGIAAMESQGADVFFGEPALDIRDWLRQDNTGRGFINILHSESLINNPRMYSTFLLWMLSELFEILPEVGDPELPRMIFFFDEAHLLFRDAPKALVQKIEQVVKLIRSKGVGVYFVTQNPRDIPDSILSQLGNKIQHAFHAYTPAEQKSLRAAADSFRINPDFKTIDVLQELGTGEALVSFLQADGTPDLVRRAKILPPQSLLGSLDDTERTSQIHSSFLYFRYGEAVDRDSAYEFLQRLHAQQAQDAQAEKERIAQEKAAEKERIAQEKAAEKERVAQEKAAEKERIAREKEAEKQKQAAGKRVKSAVGNVAKTAGGTVGREIGKTLGSSIGGTFGKTLGGNLGASLGRGLLGTLFGK